MADASPAGRVRSRPTAQKLRIMRAGGDIDPGCFASAFEDRAGAKDCPAADNHLAIKEWHSDADPTKVIGYLVGDAGPVFRIVERILRTDRVCGVPRAVRSCAESSGSRARRVGALHPCRVDKVAHHFLAAGKLVVNQIPSSPILLVRPGRCGQLPTPQRYCRHFHPERSRRERHRLHWFARKRRSTS